MQKHSTKTTKATKRTPARKRDRSQTITVDFAAGLRKLEKRRLAGEASKKDRLRLAEAISTILHRPLTAPRLFNAVGDFITEISTPLLMTARK